MNTCVIRQFHSLFHSLTQHWHFNLKLYNQLNSNLICHKWILEINGINEWMSAFECELRINICIRCSIGLIPGAFIQAFNNSSLAIILDSQFIPSSVFQCINSIIISANIKLVFSLPFPFSFWSSPPRLSSNLIHLHLVKPTSLEQTIQYGWENKCSRILSARRVFHSLLPFQFR